MLLQARKIVQFFFYLLLSYFYYAVGKNQNQGNTILRLNYFEYCGMLSFLTQLHTRIYSMKENRYEKKIFRAFKAES